MKRSSIALFLLYVAALSAQTRTVPVNGPDGKPMIGKDGKPVTVTLSTDVAGPDTPPPAVPPDKVIIAIDDEKITAGELERLIQALPEQMRGNLRGPGRRQFAENIVRVKLLAREARKKKLDQTPGYQAQAAFQSENLLAGLLFQEMTRNLTVDEAAARTYYNQLKADYESVRARHILVRMSGSPLPVRPGQKDLSEEEAKAKAQDLRQKIAGGADFAALAKAESDDAGSGANGGDLGVFGHGQMVPSFEQAAFTLPVGQVSEPVRSQFGYHVIQVQAREAKTFEEVRPTIEQRLRPEMAQKALEDMRKSAAVTIDPVYFGEEKKPEPPKPQPNAEQKKP